MEGVHGSRNGKLPAIAGENSRHKVAKEDCGGRAWGQVFGEVIQRNGSADGELDDFVDEHGGRGIVANAIYGRHDARIVHDLEIVSPGAGAREEVVNTLESASSFGKPATSGVSMAPGVVGTNAYRRQREVLQRYSSESGIGIRHGGCRGYRGTLCTAGGTGEAMGRETK